MKRAVAIILSLFLIWIQAVAAVQTTPSSAAAKCGCCTPKRVCCCVEPAAANPNPLSAAPVIASNPINFTAVIPKLIVWTLPEIVSTIDSSTDTSSPSLPIPLFQRDCALLI